MRIMRLLTLRSFLTLCRVRLMCLAVLIIPTTTFLADSVGWRHTYHIIGLASLGFCAVFYVFAASSPSECWYIKADELKYLEMNVAKPKSKGTPSKAGIQTRRMSKGSVKEEGASLFSKIIGMPSNVALSGGLWAVFGAHMAFNFGAYYLTNWSPTYYKDVLGLSPTKAYIHLMIPHFTNLAAKSSNPMIVAALAKNGYSLLASRKVFTCTGFLLATLVLMPVPMMANYSVWWSTLLFSLANAFFGLAPSGFKANYLDITEEYVGIIAGYGNTLGTVASFIQPKLLARILEATGATSESTATGSWSLVLATVGLSNMLAAINYASYATVHPIEKGRPKTE